MHYYYCFHETSFLLLLLFLITLTINYDTILSMQFSLTFLLIFLKIMHFKILCVRECQKEHRNGKAVQGCMLQNSFAIYLDLRSKQRLV